MKIILIACVCLFFALNASGQIEKVLPAPPVGIEKITLMRDDGDGNAGEETAVFNLTDSPIHCRVLLDSVKSSVVKMNLIALNVSGLKADTEIISVSYKTNGEENIVNFTGSPGDVWLAGKYRMDIFVNGKFAGNKEFEFIKSPAPEVRQTNFIPPKPKRARKN